jgi:hypothetical protein
MCVCYLAVRFEWQNRTIEIYQPVAGLPDMPFDAHQEASTLDHLAKNRIDTKDGLAENMALAKEWANLTQSQRNETGKAVVEDFASSKWNTLPKPTIHLDENGDCNAIDFSSSHLDFRSGPKHVKVANDGEKAIWVSSS